jgi:hypothetical protein
MTRVSSVAVVLCASLLLGWGCGNGPHRAPESDGVVESSCGTPATSETAAVFAALEPHCAGCHQSGPRGYFRSLETFQASLVSSAEWIRPGDPEGSELIRLLEGRGTGRFAAMPIGERSYAELVVSGAASLPVEEIRRWISGLPAQTRDSRPSAEPPRIRRLGAIEIKRALYQQLGLDDHDFFDPTASVHFPRMVQSREYGLAAMEEVPAPFHDDPAELHQSLGGGSIFRETSEDLDTTPIFAMTLTHISQSWCRVAVQKSGNTALFPDGPPGPDVAEVKALIHQWSSHFHSVDVTDAEARSLVDTLYVPLRDGADHETALVGLCAYFIRHPSWMFY